MRDLLPKRACFYVGDFANKEGFFEPSIIHEGEPGHTPTGLDYGRDSDTAQWLVELMNHRIGLSPDDVNSIVCSSMRASVKSGETKQ